MQFDSNSVEFGMARSKQNTQVLTSSIEHLDVSHWDLNSFTSPGIWEVFPRSNIICSVEINKTYLEVCVYPNSSKIINNCTGALLLCLQSVIFYSLQPGKHKGVEQKRSDLCKACNREKSHCTDLHEGAHGCRSGIQGECMVSIFKSIMVTKNLPVGIKIMKPNKYWNLVAMSG